MTGGTIWLPFLSSPIEQQPTPVDDDTPASPAMPTDPHAESPVVKSAPPPEAALSAPTAIPPLEPRLRVHYDGPLHWKGHPELTQRLEDATAALEGAGWTLDRQLALKGVRLPEGVFNFQPTLYAVMNVSGVSREQLVNHLAPKRLKQRKALEGKPEPVPDVFEEHEQLFLGYAWPRETQKFGSLKEITDSLPTILPGDKMVWELWEDGDQSTTTESAKKRRAPRYRGDKPRTESEEREMVRDSIRRSLLKNGPQGAEVGARDVDAFLADAMGLDSVQIDDGLGDDSPEQEEPIVPTDDEDEDEDEETLADVLASQKKQKKAKPVAPLRTKTMYRIRSKGATVVEEGPPPPPNDVFALPRREPYKIPKITPAPARELVKSKRPTGDPVSATVAIREFSNAARAIGSKSDSDAASALTRLAGMNIPFKVLFQLGDCPKHIKQWAKSGSTGEIRAAANMCVETWRGVVQTIPEEERKAARKEAQNARETPEPEPEPVHHDSRATFVSGYYASYLEAHADRKKTAIEEEEALGRAISALNAIPGRKMNESGAAWARESPAAAQFFTAVPPPPPPIRGPAADVIINDVIVIDDESPVEKDTSHRSVLRDVPPPPPPPGGAVIEAPPGGSELPPTVREVKPPPAPSGRTAGMPPPPEPYDTDQPDVSPPFRRTEDKIPNAENGETPEPHLWTAYYNKGTVEKVGKHEPLPLLPLPLPRNSYHCAACNCNVPTSGREQHETGAKHRENEKSEPPKRVVKVIVRERADSDNLRDRIDRTPCAAPVIRDKIVGVGKGVLTPMKPSANAIGDRRSRPPEAAPPSEDGELPLVLTTSSGLDGLPEAKATIQPAMVLLAQGLVPMLPVTQLVSVRTAQGDVVYLAPMQPIAQDQPGVQAVDRVTNRTHATETTTTRPMTVGMVRSESEPRRMTRAEWERERKEMKREKKEKNEKKREREGGGDEDGRGIVKRTKSGWPGWMQNDDFLRLDDSYDASLPSGCSGGF